MGDFIVSIINFIIDSIVTIVNALVYIMPDSPFRGSIEAINSGVGSEILGYINYFLPVSEMVTLLSVWLASVLLYYAVSVVLRWAKAIS